MESDGLKIKEKKKDGNSKMATKYKQKKKNRGKGTLGSILNREVNKHSSI